jgi:hypothetical protein
VRLIAAALTVVFLTIVFLSMPLLSASSQELARGARTPEEHQKLADYYRAQSKALREESSGWAAMAAEYERNPASHPIPKFPTWGDHCRSLSRQYLKDAKKAEALAVAQERLARERAARTSCSACKAVAALAVKCPIFRPGRGSILP